MSGTVLTVESEGAIEIVTLNRPDQLNAVSPELAQALLDYFSGLPARLETRVVILRGAGRMFCAGAELGSDAFANEGPGRNQRQLAMQRLYSGIVRAMRACPQPVIALLHGAACGAGFSLALAADVRIAAEDARLNAAYLRVGLGGCDMGSGYLLPRLVGLSVASELLMTGNFIAAPRALATGLVSSVVAGEALMEAGLAMARDMLRASPMGLRMTKETLNLTVDAPGLDAALTLEDRQQCMLIATADHETAVEAFRNRAAPEYRDL
ncbi:enoyl-CoA hydratase-related protein [Novosphingobium sp. fls2-241-R2A-195]|jgi:enoyl-CoA hydratase/carnithine racemase|uniref:enoyl-CoA hydratase/isomerase family protein n=1 Tax=Novosphingobium sp. fls2-241-R2A-195 TaxID=3040296 RepID=UPI00254EC995|nr:enoyl-CoA hydratase-related protein [Novosphingobium sp. fls2-241-R2A-195]